MVYDSGPSVGDGMWHCPFSREWVAKMSRAAKACKQIHAKETTREEITIQVGTIDFLAEEQDERGLPLSWCMDYDKRHKDCPNCCMEIYDYDSIPDIVVTNGEGDWPFTMWEYKLMA